MSQTLDAYQVTTLLFGLVVLWLVISDYKNSTYSTKWGQLRTIVKTGLPLLFAAYATIVTGAAGTRNADMYKNAILVLGIGSFVFSSINVWGTSGKWAEVAGSTSAQLAGGALFAVPIAYFGFK